MLESMGGAASFAELESAKQLLGTASITCAEAFFMSLLQNDRLTDDDRRGRAKNCMTSISKQTEDYGVDVLAGLHPTIRSHFMAVVLKQKA